MKGSTAGSNQKAPAGEWMQSCLSENVNVTAQTVHTWSHSLRFAGEKLATLGAKCQCVLEQNGIHLFAYMLMQLLHLEQISSRFLDLGSDWIKAPVFTPCFSGFGTPQRKGEDQWRQWKKSSEDTCLWFRELDHTTVRRWEWVTFLSLSITSSLGPSKGGNQQMPCQESVVQLPFRCSTSAVYENSAESNLTLSNGRRSEFPLWDTGTSWETTAI